MFTPATGDLLGVAMTPNYLAVEWNGPGRIIASYAQRGGAISAHFASNKEGLRHIKTAIDDFCKWVLIKYEWCSMIIAIIAKRNRSVMRIVSKCGFFPVCYNNEINVYARHR